MQIRIASTIAESIVDGPGIRYVVFTQGCPHHCPGCHNPSTHDFNQGKLIEIDELINDMKKYPYMSGLTISGGEPFAQDVALLELINKYHQLYKNKNILIFTGYTYEELKEKHSNIVEEIFAKIDYLIDGRYVASLRDLSLVYRGSSNQRIIDMKKTYNNTQIVIKEF